eukprot:s2438_g2.t1
MAELPDNQLGDTQLYPDHPGASECTPKKKESVDQDAVPETVEVHDSQDGTPPVEPSTEAEPTVPAEPAGQPTQEAEKSAPEAVQSARSEASGSADQEPLPVEQFDWSTLKKLPANYCSSCRQPVEADPTKRVTKKGHAALSCKRCHNVTTMLYKRINMQSVGFKDIPPAQALIL